MTRNYFEPVAPRKHGATLDISSARLPGAPRTISLRPGKNRAFDGPQGRMRSLDGVRVAQPTLLQTARERSWKELAMRAYRRSEILVRRSRRLFWSFVPAIAPRKMVYGSLAGGVALGMMGMSVIGQFTGEDVAAQVADDARVAGVATAETPELERTPYNFENDIFFEYFSNESEEVYQDNVRKLVAGHPIEEMLPYIFEKDYVVAAFLIGIAKKESNWGKRVPVLNGQDCFNYWGYRGIRKMMGSGGHTCFNSRKDAVDTVAKRLETLIHAQKLDTPEKLIVWKCGYSCEGHSRESVRKWIADVDHYFREASYE